MEDYNEQIEEFTKIHESAIPVYSMDDKRNTIGNIHLNEYELNEYDVEKPTMKEVEAELMEKAQSEVSSVMFWKLDELKKEYVEENKDQVYKEKVKQWEKDKEDFLNKEMENASIANQLYIDEISSNKGLINALLENNEEIVNEEISNWVASIEFPFEFDLQFELDENILRVDLDLPEIEEMLNEKATQMANGEIKIKEKTQKEIKEDYSDCVFGLAIFVTSYLFNIALGATDIILSAYTQRRNTSGKMIDDYILSVHFTRDEFTKLNYTKDPRSNCFKFDNICLQTSDNTFKTIKPFE